MPVADLIGLGPSSLQIRRVRVLIETIVVTLVAVVAVLLVSRFTDWTLPWWLVVGLVVVNTVASFWWASAEHRRWGWHLSDDLLEVQRGVVVDKVSLVPRSRIQNVTTSVGPLQRRFGLLTLTVHTAGTRTPNVSIPDMDAGQAEGIRRQLGLV